MWCCLWAGKHQELVLGMVVCGKGPCSAVRYPQAEQLLSASLLSYIQRLHFHYSSPFRGTIS